MGGRILIVEDDAIIRLDMAGILRDQGYEVVAAAHGKAALAILREDPGFDLALIDLVMPMMDGYRLRLEMMKDERLARIPAVILSASSDLGQQAADLEAAGFLEKPFVVDALVGTVARHLKGA